MQSTATLAAAALLPPVIHAESGKRSFRVAHLTDIHVKPGAIPEAGMALALNHVQDLKPGVDFIINGGDAIMDALEADKDRTAIQWKLFIDILKKENSQKVHHVIGNHDVWGWFIKGTRPDNDRLYGKVWAVETLSMPARYYSFDHQKWHFIILDSTQLNPAGGYIGKLDPEQMEWLSNDLARVKAGQYVCIVSHIPILSICAGLFFDRTETNGDLLIKRNLMHSDFIPLKKLFLKYPNIKACISGHIHLQDQLEYLGIRYYCNGAVSGSWWKGAYQEFEPAYAVMEFFDDGSTKRTMINYDLKK